MKSKLENFWYYHKYHLLAALLALLALIVAVKSCSAKKKYDVSVLLLTHSTKVTAIQTDSVGSFIAGFAEDVDGNGEVAVQVKSISYGYSAKEANSAVSARLALLAAGNDLLLVLDSQDYAELKEGGFIADLSPFGGSGDKLEAGAIGLYAAVPGLDDDDYGYVLCLRTKDNERFGQDPDYAAKYSLCENVIRSIINQ